MSGETGLSVQSHVVEAQQLVSGLVPGPHRNMADDHAKEKAWRPKLVTFNYAQVRINNSLPQLSFAEFD